VKRVRFAFSASALGRLIPGNHPADQNSSESLGAYRGDWKVHWSLAISRRKQELFRGSHLYFTD